jgi:ParB family chromosome partitioning protein
MRLKDLADSTSDLFNLPVEALDIDPAFNVRTDTPELAAHVLALADSIAAIGFLSSKPLVVRLAGDRAIVVDGHCRLAAVRVSIARGCEIKRLPCLPEARGTSAAERALMLLTANNGLPLSALEQAAVCKRLVAFGWTETEIGARIGRTRQHVANLLDLAASPDAIREAVAGGAVSAREAVLLVRSEGEAGAVAVLEKAVAASPKGKATAGVIKAVKAGTPVSRAPRPVPETAPYHPRHEPEVMAHGELARACREFLAAWDGGADYEGVVLPAIGRLRSLVSPGDVA